VVVLVRHTLLLGGVGLDVNNVSDLVHPEEGGEGDHSLVLESSLEHVTRTRAHSEGVRHFLGRWVGLREGVRRQLLV
jgi:hypothetical protein